MSDFDVIVIGGGLAGLTAGLRQRQLRPDGSVLVVEAQAAPGGSVRSQRSNGFLCELGPFAFAADELDEVLPLLRRPPRVIPANEAATTGWLFDGSHCHRAAVAPPPLSFSTGCEDLVQAARRELADTLRLGRAVTSIEPAVGGFVVELGGEVPSRLHATEVVMAVKPPVAGRLLAAFDPRLTEVSTYVVEHARALVWFGGIAADAPELRGYGVLPHPDLDTAVSELIFCTEVFPNRAMPGRCLVRAELSGPDLDGDDDVVLRAAESELRRWTHTRATFGFTKVHRYTINVPDGASTECRTRLVDLATRVPGLAHVL